MEDDHLVIEVTLNTKDTHSKHVLGLIDSALALSGVTLETVDAYAVTTGPGSFTGLRIGLSVIKGMALGGKKPVVGISSLDALAIQGHVRQGLVCVLMDARRKEVYCARYVSEKGKLKRTVDAAVVSPEKALSDLVEECTFIGSGAVLHQDLILSTLGEKAFFPPPSCHGIRASSVAYLGLRQLRNPQKIKEDPLAPEYLRASDAELKWNGR
jgi:tRNA threonylcarbamoyladenosine biosynthesis protein TsaB